MNTNTNKYFLKMKFLYENLFYQFCTTDRLSKLIAQLKVFEIIKDVNGDIVEFGVFKGNSLSRLIIFREIFSRKNHLNLNHQEVDNDNIHNFDRLKILVILIIYQQIFHQH